MLFVTVPRSGYQGDLKSRTAIFALCLVLFQLLTLSNSGTPHRMPTTESGVTSDWCLVPDLYFDFWTEKTSEQTTSLLLTLKQEGLINWISRELLLSWSHIIFRFLPATSLRHAELQSHTHAHSSRCWGRFSKYLKGESTCCMILRLLITLDFFSEAAVLLKKTNIHSSSCSFN